MFYPAEAYFLLSNFWYNLCNIMFSWSCKTLSKNWEQEFYVTFLVSRLGLVLVVLKRDDGGVRGWRGATESEELTTYFKLNGRPSLLMLRATLF